MRRLWRDPNVVIAGNETIRNAYVFIRYKLNDFIFDWNVKPNCFTSRFLFRIMCHFLISTKQNNYVFMHML